MTFSCRRPVAYIEFGKSIAGQEEAWKASTTITLGVTGGRSVFTGTTTPAGVELVVKFKTVGIVNRLAYLAHASPQSVTMLISVAKQGTAAKSAKP